MLLVEMVHVSGEGTQTDLVNFIFTETNLETGTVKCGPTEAQNSDDWILARRINQKSDGRVMV
jgi:hypothetical protein